MISIFTPQYRHRPVSEDERFARKVFDPLNPEEPMPDRCEECGAQGSIRNPLMAKPFFRMDHGGPKGTLYQVRCSECQIKRVSR